MAVEIEKKYRLTESLRKEIVDELEEFGAEFEGERFEENTLYASDTLVTKKAVLRLRRTNDGSFLTFKKRIENISNAKRQIEFESRVDDAEAIRSIIEELGLKAALVYEKRRRTYKFRSVEVVLDELPFGIFMEIEGSISSIGEAEMLLGIEDLEIENETYPRMTMRLGVSVGDVIESRFPVN